MSWKASPLAMLLLTMKIQSKSHCECSNKAWSCYTVFPFGIFRLEKHHTVYFTSSHASININLLYFISSPLYTEGISTPFWSVSSSSGLSFFKSSIWLVITIYKQKNACLTYTWFWKDLGFLTSTSNIWNSKMGDRRKKKNTRIFVYFIHSLLPLFSLTDTNNLI